MAIERAEGESTEARSFDAAQQRRPASSVGTTSVLVARHKPTLPALNTPVEHALPVKIEIAERVSLPLLRLSPMCGRFKRTTWSHDWKAFYGVDHDEYDDAQKPSFNVAPTQVIAVVRADDEGERHLVGMRWGLIPSWAKDRKIGNKLINARADGIATKPAYRSAFKRRRCVIPMDAFYEWRDGADGKVPYLVERADHAPLGAAGLWETWRDPETDEKIETTTIVTTDAVDNMRELHDRMPVFIPPSRFGTWLAHDTPTDVAAQLLLPTRDLVMRRVSKRLNNPRNDDASVLKAD